MDETDISLFSSKKKSKSKHDKADATSVQPTTPIEQSVDKKLIISRPTDQDTYFNDYPNAGIALIFNHENVKGQKPRVGTVRDCKTMANTLTEYGFDVRVHNDLTFADLTEQLKAAAAEDHSENDCLVVVVMSHGTEGRVYARDMSYPVERLWNPFLGDSCKSLINKPKLFFIQACRGENLDKPVTFSEFAPMSRELTPRSSETMPQPITYAIPNTADILVMYSTFEKHFSFRNVEAGSWFIQSLCQVFDEAAMLKVAQTEGVELLRLLTAVNRRVAYEYQSFAKVEAFNQMKEMPNFMSTLTKMCYLRVKPKQ